MTPIEKAKELVKKYYNFLHFEFGDYVMQNDRQPHRCATLCVDEIMKLECLTDEAWLSVPQEYKIQYWREVKSEIDKL